MKRDLLVIMLLVLLVVPPAIAAPGAAPDAPLADSVSLTGPTAYTEDFGTLASTGTSSTTPNGWWFLESGTNANTTYAAGTGSGNAGDTYSFGATGNSERAFGGLLSGSLAPTIGAQFTNNAGNAISALAIQYNCEQWRLGAIGRTDRLDFQYSLDATSLTAGVWTAVAALNCSSAVTTGTVGALDGNAAANRTAISGNITGLNIADGTTFWIRWNDFNATGADDGLAMDDFSLTPTVSVGDTPPTIAGTTPADNATNVSTGTTIAVNFSEAVDLTASAVTLECPAATSIEFTGLPATNGTSVTLTPNAALPANTLCKVTVVADQVSDRDGIAPLHMAANHVWSFTTDTPPMVSSTTPAKDATGVAINATITINFNEIVDAGVNVFTLECPAGTPGTSVTFTSNPTLPANDTSSIVLTPSANLPNSTICTVTAVATQITDNDGAVDQLDGDKNGTGGDNYSFTFTTVAADPCSESYTHTYDIQGSGAAAAITGAVTTQGVVVGDYELPTGSGQLRGFYIQDVTGDGNSATSDGLFIYDGGTDNVSVGQVVRVTGTASEYQDQTQVSSTGIIQCGTTANVTSADINLPFASATALEPFEGMLVRFPQILYVTEHFQLGRFGQVVLSSGGRLRQPTNVAAPGAPALAVQAANDLNRIIVDDANNQQNVDPIVFGRGGNPLSASNTLRGGDTATGLVGVLTYGWAGNSASGNAYRLRPIGSLNGVVNFAAANARPPAPAAAGRLRVTAANLLNYFNTFTGCMGGVNGAAMDCRGAGNQEEFDRQWPKTVANLVGGGADVIAIMEMENDGYGSTSAIQHLVDKLTARADAGTYAFINPDTTAGTNSLGTDAIKVGLIYKPGKVTPVGTTAALNTADFVNGGDSAPRNRPALAQAFEENSTGKRFIVVANHLKSKGSACDAPDAGDGQGNCNAVRTNAANALTAWLAGNPTDTGDPDILIMGDLNAYAKEDPITAIKNAGYTNLPESLIGPSAYSYVFDGQWGYLDHALGTASLTAQVASIVEWHINADEPSALDYNTDYKSATQINILYDDDQFRSGDHDPVIVGLNLTSSKAIVLLPLIMSYR